MTGENENVMGHLRLKPEDCYGSFKKTWSLGTHYFTRNFSNGGGIFFPFSRRSKEKKVLKLTSSSFKNDVTQIGRGREDETVK